MRGKPFVRFIRWPGINCFALESFTSRGTRLLGTEYIASDESPLILAHKIRQYVVAATIKSRLYHRETLVIDKSISDIVYVGDL